MLLRDLISVAPRYARSINIERDSRSATALDGYIVTATAQRTLGRITGALGNDLSQRAWTITAPSNRSLSFPRFSKTCWVTHGTTS